MFGNVVTPGGLSKFIGSSINVDAYWIIGSRSTKLNPNVSDVNSANIKLNGLDSKSNYFQISLQSKRNKDEFFIYFIESNENI